MDTSVTSPISINVSPDRLSATVQTVGSPAGTPSIEDVTAALQAAGIAASDDVQANAKALVDTLAKGDPLPEEGFLLARGRASADGRDGTVAWVEALDPETPLVDDGEDGAIDYYSVSAIRTVEEGGLIGKIQPPTAGVDGVDVCGTPLVAKGRPQPVTLGAGVELGNDGVSVLATTAGRVLFDNLKLSVTDVVEIAGNVDFESGSLDVETDVLVRGGVQDLFQVKTTGSLTVGEAIEAAEVEAGGDVVVRGGILNRGRGKVRAGGSIAAKFCDEADLHAEGDIRVSREVMNSHIHTEDNLIMPGGSIIGGVVFSRHGIEAGILGSEAAVPTTIAVGLHPDEIRLIEDTAKQKDQRLAAIEKIRQAVGPLMAQLKRLTNEQREKATELMYQADSAEAELKAADAHVEALHQKGFGDTMPSVLVSSRIHQRVSVSVGDRVVTFHEEFRGPIRIEQRKIKNYAAIVAVNQLTGSIRELPARKLEVEPAEAAP
ncbi:MAG: DUF342 domain-containing protein [bacterium]|nr:DUF342 domain-containing protein [bacterium]